jgi:hypothetical protein
MLGQLLLRSYRPASCPEALVSDVVSLRCNFPFASLYVPRLRSGYTVVSKCNIIKSKIRETARNKLA